VVTQRLFRSQTDRMLGGVCGGIGAYLGIDPTIVRLVFVVAAILTGGLVALLYVVLWIIVPEEPRWTSNPTGFETSQTGTSDPGTATPPPAGQTGEGIGSAPYGWAGGSTGYSNPAANPWHEERRRRRNQWGGWVLVIIGMIVLAGNLHLFDWLNFRLTWPLFLIAAGLYLLLRRRSEL